MKRILAIFFILIIFKGNSQTFFENDTTFNKKRVVWASGTIGAGFVGSLITLQNVWYKEHWTNFHLFDDSKEWLGMDKVGHVYTSNMVTKNITRVYNWAGMNRKSSLLIGSSISLAYQTTLEIFDGFSNEWGFSWSDMGANALGIVWFAWQDLTWQEQRLKMKFSTFPSSYAQYRPNVLGNTFAQRLLKDYNGQTYWFSITPKQFLSPSSCFPNWLSFSLGYSVDGKLHGEDNIYTVQDEFGENKIFHAQRQFLFSLDVDFEQFNPKKKWLKTVFQALNHLKVPFPSLILTGKNISVHPFYF